MTPKLLRPRWWRRRIRRLITRLRRSRPRALPPIENRVVLANRADGLGYRLNALLNAIRLADLLGVEFRLVWPLKGQVPTDTTHAIEPAEEFFSAEFLADHLVDDAASTTGLVLPEGRSVDLDSLRVQITRAERGLLAPASPLTQLIDAKAVPDVSRGYSAEFARIGFHPQIEAAIAAARGVHLSAGAVGIHLRAGDNVFGRFRTVNRFWNKAIPAPIARELIVRSRSEGHDVIVFGQDAELIAELCSSTGAIDATTVRPPNLGSRSADAMFDVVLMSRCERIIAGDSGFAVQAAAIGDKQVEFHVDLTSPEESLEIIRTDLRANGDRYHPVQRAFAWWVAYYRVRADISYADAVELITAAVEDDPDNPRSRLRLAALSFREGHIARGDEVLADALVSDVESGRKQLQSVMLFGRRPGNRFDSQEILDDFDRAADGGSGPATIYRAAIRAKQGDAAGAMAEAAAFRAHAATDPRLAGLSDLDELVEATIEKLSSSTKP